MIIQWFPGHKTKALRMMRESIKLVDTVVYILDSRTIYSSINPSFDELIANKPVLYVFNKADLVQKNELIKWAQRFEREGKNAIIVSGNSTGSAKLIRDNLLKLNAKLIENYRQKGVNRTVRAMVIGIPNCGKSTIINTLCGQKRAMTGDKAGVTKGKQWVKIDDSLELLDTPGTLCPSFENEVVGLHLAYIGSINDLIVDKESLALKFIEEMSQKYPNELKNRYNLSEICSAPLETYEQICKKRGFILRGNECDYERGGLAVIDDFRKGRLGNIILEKTSDFEPIEG